MAECPKSEYISEKSPINVTVHKIIFKMFVQHETLKTIFAHIIIFWAQIKSGKFQLKSSSWLPSILLPAPGQSRRRPPSVYNIILISAAPSSQCTLPENRFFHILSSSIDDFYFLTFRRRRSSQRMGERQRTRWRWLGEKVYGARTTLGGLPSLHSHTRRRPRQRKMTRQSRLSHVINPMHIKILL